MLPTKQFHSIRCRDDVAACTLVQLVSLLCGCLTVSFPSACHSAFVLLGACYLMVIAVFQYCCISVRLCALPLLLLPRRCSCRSVKMNTQHIVVIKCDDYCDENLCIDVGMVPVCYQAICFIVYICLTSHVDWLFGWL